MKLFPHFRAYIVRFALFSMLFMQLAGAAYSCPMMAAEHAQTATSMLNCDGMAMDMNMEHPTLCLAKVMGDPAKQSLDKSELPQVPAFIPTGLVLTLPIFETVDHPSITPRDSLVLVRSTAPPVAILHCCFRI